MKLYHATTKETMMKIVGEGVLRPSWCGFVYLCDKPEDACKFLTIRGMRKMSVIEVDVDASEVKTSCDHNIRFFQCEAYIHEGEIKLTGRENVWDYEFDF